MEVLDAMDLQMCRAKVRLLGNVHLSTKMGC